MKTRIKFTKSGPLKFVGHLDVMGFFQKAFRRADIEVELSQGYSPHQIISFASPLGLGQTSDCEYVDVQIANCEDRETMLNRMNSVMNEYIHVVDFKLLDENSKNAMSIVSAADYMVSLRDNYEFISDSEFQVKFNEFMEQEQIVALKKSKRTQTEVDIKPYIYKFEVGSFENLKPLLKEKEDGAIDTNISVADVYDNNVRVCLQLATGSVTNIKPDLVMEAFCNYIGKEYQPFMFQIHRFEVYSDSRMDGNLSLIPLMDV